MPALSQTPPGIKVTDCFVLTAVITILRTHREQTVN